MQYAPTLPADGTRWLIKWIPTGANGRRAHISENISGASDRQPLPLDIPTRVPERQPLPLENILEANGCHRPIKWFSTEANGRRAHVSENISGADERHPPIKWFSTEANGRRAPPSDVRVGAYCIRPQTIRTWNDSVWPRAARKKVSDGSESAFWAPIRFQFTSK